MSTETPSGGFALPPSGQNPLNQSELDHLLALNGFLNDHQGANKGSLIDELEDAVLDSGRLTISEWVALRDRLKAIERLIPHIDLIIQLKGQRRRSASGGSDRHRAITPNQPGA
jgi:hypothetical protein